MEQEKGLRILITICNFKDDINKRLLIGLLLGILINTIGCHMETSTISKLKNLREFSREEIVEQFLIAEEHIEKGLQYERLDSLTKYHNPNEHPAHFYFSNDELKMVYISDEGFLSNFSFKKLKQILKGNIYELPSRAGKIPHYTFPQDGIAMSVDHDKIVFLEIFPPCSLAKYQSEIYEEPTPFIK